MIAKYSVTPFRSWHMKWLQDNGGPSDRVSLPTFSHATLTALENTYTWTGTYDGNPIACGGILPQWPGRYLAWLYITADSSKHMLFLTRQARKCLTLVGGRLELTIRSDFAAGHKWAHMLGFQVETPCLKAYGPDGEDHTGYTRMNHV